jgi:hypothetical protein
VPDLRDAGHQQDARDHLADEPQRVRGDEDQLAVDPVGDHAGREREHGEGQELCAGHQADLAGTAADREHREGQGHHHDPVADHAECLAGEEQPELRLGAQHVGQQEAQDRRREATHGGQRTAVRPRPAPSSDRR